MNAKFKTCKVRALLGGFAFLFVPTQASAALFQTSGNNLIMSNANVRVEYNLISGRANFYWQNALKIKGFYSGVDLDKYITGTSYGSHTYSILSTNQVVVISTQGGMPTMKQYFTLNHDNSFLTRVELSGSALSSTWMGAVVMDSTGGIDIGSQNDCRALCVPFDNDAWTRYNAMSINNTAYSYEVAAFYDNSTRNGLVVGSVTHNTWKTGIYFSGSNNKLNALNVYGGITSSETRDVGPHGPVVGNIISSPTVFVGFGVDWRATLEDFSDANAAQVPKLPWTNGVPFGWNSWYAFGANINHAKAVTVSDFIKNRLQTNSFSNKGTVYVNLDSYWDNMSNSELVDFVNHCHSNGQQAGIYWSPFVWWGSSASLSNSTVEGSIYRYSDIALRTSSGGIQTLDGAIAMDPTHPGTKQRAAGNLKLSVSKSAQEQQKFYILRSP